jgi:hypothetical protein
MRNVVWGRTFPNFIYSLPFTATYFDVNTLMYYHGGGRSPLEALVKLRKICPENVADFIDFIIRAVEYDLQLN